MPFYSLSKRSLWSLKKEEAWEERDRLESGEKLLETPNGSKQLSAFPISSVSMLTLLDMSSRYYHCLLVVKRDTNKKLKTGTTQNNHGLQP